MLTPSRKMGDAMQLDDPINANLEVAAPVIAPSPNGGFPSELAAGSVQIDTYLVPYSPVSRREIERSDNKGGGLPSDERVSNVVDRAEVNFGAESYEEIGPSALETMGCLLKAFDYARKLGVDVWDFAVEIEAVRRLGIGATELRWLVGSGWATEAQETTAAGDDRRMFSRGGFLTFDAQTCFVLTERGVAAARHLREQKQTPGLTVDVGTMPDECGPQATLERPQWIADRQQLFLGGELVKQFKLPSPNQIAILSAFEEEAWPPHVDDPLPMSSTVGPKERLRYTIKSLNKHQKQRKIRFRGDGRGEGICWEVWEQGSSS